MDITFFLGNGFDLNLGLKTRYKDFYPFFAERASKENIIKKWILEDSSSNFETWADLEKALGQSTAKLSIDDKDKFLDDKDEMDDLLLEYLEEQQSLIDSDDINQKAEEFIRSMKEFPLDLAKQGVEDIKKTKIEYRNEPTIYNVVSFNYTNVIDRIMEKAIDQNPIGTRKHSNGHNPAEMIGQLIHIHGTIEKEMILGVNDETQITNSELREDPTFLDVFVKSQMNQGIAQNKINAVRDILKKSHIVYVYGMSFGETDKMWWDILAAWSLSNVNNRLIIQSYDEDYLKSRKTASTTIRKEKILFNKMLLNTDYDSEDELKGRIYAVLEPSIFNFT